MLKGLKYRLYPNNSQKELIAKHIGSSRFTPSSKTCSNCGRINKELQLKDRKWVCSGCYKTLDRDINAAINIKSFALKNNLSEEHRLKNQDELPRLLGVLTPEAQHISSAVEG